MENLNNTCEVKTGRFYNCDQILQCKTVKIVRSHCPIVDESMKTVVIYVNDESRIMYGYIAINLIAEFDDKVTDERIIDAYDRNSLSYDIEGALEKVGVKA